MKKIKFACALLSSGILIGSVLPLVSCNNQKAQSDISILGTQVKKYMHAVNPDPYPAFNLKLKNKLETGQTLSAEVKNLTGSNGVTCKVIGVDVQDQIVAVSMEMSGFAVYGDYCSFSLEFKCLNSSGNTVWTNTHHGFKLIAAESYNYFVNNLYDNTINEFIEWSKYPHPSNPADTHTYENDTLNIVRNYLKKRIEKLGSVFNRDEYGNVWFDIPASIGFENYPTLIMQGHMDMVVRGFTTEIEERSIGIDVVKSIDDDGKEILTCRGNKEEGFRKTSIGSDDGVAIAIILALLENPEFQHGALRILFTSDEETGLYGATALDPSVLNTDYLLCLDGEGTRQKPISICNSCYGFNEYTYTKQFNSVEKTLNNVFQFTTDNFKGEHYYSNIHYTNEGAQLFANPDALIFKALYNLTHDANNYKVEMSNYTHKLVGDEKRAWRTIAHNATIKFATDAPQDVVEAAFTAVYEDAKTKYKLEAWTGESAITQSVSTVSDPSSLKFISADDSEKLIKVFGNNIQYKISHWEGDDLTESKEEEMERMDFPTQLNNFSFTELDENCSFSGGTRSNAATIAYLDELVEECSKGWTDVFGNEGIKRGFNSRPWDTTDGRDKMITLSKEGYTSANIESFITNVRGGLEPAYFLEHRPTLQATCIGPWLEGIHTPSEVLYLETLPKVIKCTLYIVDNMWKFIA